MEVTARRPACRLGFEQFAKQVRPIALVRSSREANVSRRRALGEARQ